MEFLILFGVGQFLLGVGGILVGIATLWYVSARTKQTIKSE